MAMRAMVLAALGVLCGSAAVGQDTRAAVRAVAVKCLDARRAVAHNCSKCEGSGKEHRPVTDARGYRSIEVTCPTCSGAGLIFVQRKADEVKACFWKYSRYPAALWGRGSSGRGVNRAKRPPAALRAVDLAENAGWLTDTTSVDKVGEINVTEGVLWTDVALQIEDSTPGSFRYVKFPEGWRIVAQDEIDDAIDGALGRPGANRPAGQRAPRAARPSAGAVEGTRQAGAPPGRDAERPAGANEVRRPRGGGGRCRVHRRSGDWSEQGGALVARDAAKETWLHCAEELTDYDLTFRLRLDALAGTAAAGAPAVKVRLHVRGDTTWTALNFACAARAHLQATQRINGKWSNLNHRISGIELGREYALRFVVRGAKVESFLDDVPLMNYAANGLDRGAIGFIVHNAQATIRDFSVVAPDGRVLFEGCPGL
jgi:hypothetical protein